MTMLPDFIIGGAMKSATGTLDFVLSSHDDIFIPEGEIHFFSIDDIKECPVFFRKYKSGWAFQDLEKNIDEYHNWYKSFFSEAKPHQKVGDDSTSYLASKKAPERIAELVPEVHLIFLLRDPVARAYSHYWHALQAGRITYDFEDALQYDKEPLITRGFYKRQIYRYLRHFPRKQVTILIFEEFIKNMQEKIDTLCDTLNISSGIDLSNVDIKKQNSSQMPRWPSLLAWQNYIFRGRSGRSYRNHLPTMPQERRSWWDKIIDSINIRLRYLNLTDQSPRPMNRETRKFLENLYAKENEGISDLINIDIESYWPYMN